MSFKPLQVVSYSISSRFIMWNSWYWLDSFRTVNPKLELKCSVHYYYYCLPQSIIFEVQFWLKKTSLYKSCLEMNPRSEFILSYIPFHVFILVLKQETDICVVFKLWQAFSGWNLSNVRTSCLKFGFLIVCGCSCRTASHILCSALMKVTWVK